MYKHIILFKKNKPENFLIEIFIKSGNYCKKKLIYKKYHYSACNGTWSEIKIIHNKN
jgi:hypothetical protein